MDERALLEACRTYRLVRALRRPAGTVGGELGRRAGASVEFHDYRAYFPGDDPRHIDWAVYGRSGELTLRLHREEVRPRLEVLIDASRSMAIADGRKAELARELAAFAQRSARLQGQAAHVYAVGDELSACEEPARIEFTSRHCLLFERPSACARRLRPYGVRVLISDFMTAHAPEVAIRELAADAAALIVLMTLGPFEAHPSAEGPTTLVDAELGDELTLHLGPAQVERYLTRLRALQASLSACCRAAGATFATVVCDCALSEALRRDLLPAAVVCPT